MASLTTSIKKLALAITGFSTPVFGVNWNPPKDKRQIVKSLVIMLEDRRALYMDHHREITRHVIESVLQIRRELTNTLRVCPEDEHLTSPLRAMRAACRKFLDQTGSQASRNRHRVPFPDLTIALGELRAAFGIHLARLCVAYGVRPEPQLAALFPAPDKGEVDD